MMGKIAQATKGATKAQHSFLSAIGKAAGKSLEPLTSFAKGLANVASRFKRILMYRMVRKVISEIGKAFKEGVKNVYAWSAATGGQLAASMDDATASINYLKNSIGAAASPLINALAPAIRVVTDAVVELINVINQLLALLGGQTSWTRAIRNTDEYANAVSGAGGAAKEALRYLAPFDELNVLPKDSGGGGGGGSAVDYSSMFEETTEFAQGIADFAQSIRDAVSAGDWQGLGELLGNKVNEIVDMIDWSGIGTKIGEKINAFFTTKYWTLETINFHNIGARIAELLSSALNNIDFEVLGRGFVQGFTILPDMLIGFLGNLDWAAVGRSVGDWISGAFSQAADWVSNTDWGGVVEDIYHAIQNAVTAVDWSSVVESVFRLIGASLGAVTNIINTMVLDIADYFQNANGWELLKTWFSDVFFRGLVQQGINAINGMLKGLEDSINNFIDNYPKLAHWLGLDDHVELTLIPNLDPPPGTLYNEVKDAFKKSIPINGEVTDIMLGSGGTGNGSGGFTLQGGKLRLETMAYFTGYSNGMTSKPSVKSLANFVDWSSAGFSNLSDKWRDSKNRPRVGSVAYFKDWSSSGFSALSDKWRDGKNRPKISSFANFTSWDRNFASGTASDGRPKMRAFANFTGWDRNFASGTDSSGRPKMQANANFTTRTDNVNTTFNSTANFNNRWDNISTTFNSTANIVAQEISVAKMDGYMRIDSTANIVKTGGINHVNLNATAYITQTKQESGGVFRNGSWNPIQSYASGGSPFGGQIFRARENGNPELVGTLHGSTAVMNNDQIVASVSSGVAKAVAGIRFQMTGGGGTDTEQMMYSAFSRALAENNEEITLDGDVVYSKMLSRNRRETYRTGVNPMAAMA